MTTGPEWAWTARWELAGACGVLIIADTSGRVWVAKRTGAPAAGEAAFRSVLAVMGWAPVPGMVWAERGQAWERPVRPALWGGGG